MILQGQGQTPFREVYSACFISIKRHFYPELFEKRKVVFTKRSANLNNDK